MRQEIEEVVGEERRASGSALEETTSQMQVDVEMGAADSVAEPSAGGGPAPDTVMVRLYDPKSMKLINIVSQRESSLTSLENEDTRAEAPAPPVAASSAAGVTTRAAGRGKVRGLGPRMTVVRKR